MKGKAKVTETNSEKAQKPRRTEKNLVGMQGSVMWIRIEYTNIKHREVPLFCNGLLMDEYHDEEAEESIKSEKKR